MIIARYFPGLGDPWHLTLAQWNGILDRAQDILEGESPKDGQQAVESEMRRMKRQQRRKKARERHG